MTFDELLAALKVADDSLEGEIDFGLINELATKVDSIKFVDHKIDLEIFALNEDIQKLQKRKLMLSKNKSKLAAHIIGTMVSQESTQVPGHDWTLKLVQNPEKVVVSREPEHQDWLDHPDAVAVKVEYGWKKAYLKEHIDTFSGVAALARGNRIEFTRRPL